MKEEKYNQTIENNTNYEIRSNTSFRDIIKPNIEQPKMAVTEAKEEYGKEIAQPTETEKNNEETFESVMERLKKNAKHDRCCKSIRKK